MSILTWMRPPDLETRDHLSLIGGSLTSSHTIITLFIDHYWHQVGTVGANSPEDEIGQDPASSPYKRN